MRWTSRSAGTLASMRSRNLRNSMDRWRRCVWPITLPHRRRSEEHTSELQSRQYLVCRLLLEKKNHNRDEAPQTLQEALIHLDHIHSFIVLSFLQFLSLLAFFFFNVPPTPKIYTLSLHDVFRSDEVDIAIGGHAGVDAVQELAELDGPMAAMRLADHFAASTQIGRAHV